MSEVVKNRWSEPSLAEGQPLRIATPGAGTPEWYIAAAVKRLAADAGIELEPKHFDGGEARRVASVHEGMAEVALALVETAGWAYRAESAYDGWRHTSLRAIAAIEQTQWLGVAARWESRVGSLDELAEARSLRLHTPLPGGDSASWTFLAGETLAAHGARPAQLEERGWRVEDVGSARARVRELDFDVLVAPIGPFRGAQARLWQEASVLADLRFLPLPEPTLERLESQHGVRRGLLPAGYLRGADTPVPTICCDRWVVFASERLEDEVAVALSRGLEDRRERLIALHASLDPLRPLDDVRIPVHRAVLRDRRDRGLAPALAV
ncbi:MAG: TAXI family TRAP transporter solute-binding subunit [Gaiellaceae bacterium]